MTMISGTRLLERFVNSDGNNSLVSKESTVKESIAEYILRLFNTRKGSVIVDDQYGVPSVDVSTNDQMKRFLVDLEGQLKKYEPRIRQASLHLMSNDNVQVFSKIRFDLSVNPISAFSEELVEFELYGQFKVDGTFCFVK